MTICLFQKQNEQPADTQTITPTDKEVSASASVMKIPNKSLHRDSMDYEWIFVTFAVVCAIIVSVSAFIIMKKHKKFKNKFEGLIGGNTEVRKDYQVNLIEMYILILILIL